jgi:uncharacterized protein (TIGR02145 family)
MRRTALVNFKNVLGSNQKTKKDAIASKTPKHKNRVVFTVIGAVAFITLSFSLYNLSQTLVANIEYKPTPDNITTMQEMNPTICGEMDMYSSVTLQDPRGPQPYQSYRVRKMPDGKCWMIDNLKLELSTGMQLQPADTNVSSPTTVTLATGGLTGNFTTSGYLTTNNSSPSSTTYDAWRQVNPSDPTLTGTESCAAGQMVDESSTTGCGYLYNWYTATAGTGTYAISSGYVTSSICPAGWHLPRGADGTTAQNEFAVLNSAMYNGSTSGSTSGDIAYAKNWWHTGLFAGPRSGYYYSGFYAQDYGGNFWSSSANSSDYARYLYFNYSYVYPGTVNNLKGYGFAVRCVV